MNVSYNMEASGDWVRDSQQLGMLSQLGRIAFDANSPPAKGYEIVQA